nr:MAG: hypothetical protein [Microviridae sp.]
MKQNNRKFVLTPDQFKELTQNPTLATAVFNAFQHDSSMSTIEAFRFARMVLAQFSIEFIDGIVTDVKVNVDTGEIVTSPVKQDEAYNTPPMPIQRPVDQKPIKKLPAEAQV